MARTGKVAVSITADPSGLQKGLHGAEGDLKRFGDRGSKSLHGLKTAALGAGAALTAGVVVGLKQSFDAAVEAEKSNAKMQAQLKALGITYKAHAKQIDEVIQKTSKLSGLDDEDLQDAFTNIVRATGSVNTGLKDMALVSDLARARHMDVAKAGELVAKVHNGNVGALKRLGIALDPVTKAQDKLKESNKKATVEQVRAAKEADKTATAQKALGELQKRLGGQAEAYGKTAAGAQDRFRTAVENLKESIGAKLLPVVAKIADKAANFVTQMNEGTGAGGRFKEQLKDVYERIKPIVEFFVKHPKWIGIAIGAWGAYKVAAKASAIYTQQQLLASFRGQALAKQTAAASAAGTASGRSFGGKAAAFGGKALLAFGWAGIGVSIAQLLGVPIDKWFEDFKQRASNFATNTAAQLTTALGAGLNSVNVPGTTVPKVKVPGPKGPVFVTPKQPGSSGGGGFGAGHSLASAASVTNPFGTFVTDADRARAARQRERNLDRINDILDRQDLLVGAGRKTEDQAAGIKLTTINSALRDKKHPITSRGRLELQATANQIRLGLEERKAGFVSPAYTMYVSKRDFIDQRESAGQIGPNKANTDRAALADAALNNKFPFSKFRKKKNQLTAQERRLVQADLKAANDGLRAATQTALENFTGTDFDDAAMTAAQVDTPNDMADDRNVLTGRLGIARSQYDAAKASGDRTGIATWGALMLSLQQSIDSLDESTKKNTEALLELQKQQTENYQRLYNTSQSQYGVLTRALADIVSGELGGRMGLGFQSPAFAGGMARY